MSTLRFALTAFVIGVTSAGGAQAQPRGWPSENPPRPLSQREAKFPPYDVKLLANGMQVVTVSHHEQPAVSVRLLVRAGGVHNPPGKPGVASLAAALLDQGTTTKSAEQIADRIDYVGGALGAGAGSDLTFVNAVVMKDSFNLVMDLMADIVRNPAFAPQEIERQKQQALSSLQVSRTDAGYVASSVFERLVFGFHPYGQPNIGTPESLARITRADLQAYHRVWFVPNNMLLAIVGDVSTGEAMAAAERVFGGWARADLPTLAVPEPPPPTRRVVVVDMPGAVQTEMRVGQIGIPRKHQDSLSMDLAIRILGGEGANRLHRVLRSERGLTYGAQADSETMKLAGNFVAETSTKTSTTGEVLRLIFDEYATLQRESVGQRELGDAQAYLAGAFPLTIEIPDAIATQVLNTLFYELPITDIGTFAQRVQSVTPGDIQRVARQYILPNRLSVVLVGNAAAFVPQLASIGVSSYEVIPVDQLDITSASLRRESPRADITAPRGSVGAARLAPLGRRLAYGMQDAVGGADSRTRDLLSRAVEAKGRLATLKAVTTLVAKATTTFQTPRGPVSSSSTSTVAYPDRLRVDGRVAGVDVVQVYNAGGAWVRDPSGLHVVSAEMGEGFADSMRRDLITLLVTAAQGSITVRRLPEQGADGHVYTVLELVGDDSEGAVRLWLDSQGQVARLTFTATGPHDRAALMEERFSDYRSVDGVQIPFKSELWQDGRVAAESLFTEVTINGPVEPSHFEKPRR
jgi:zinc protease